MLKWCSKIPFFSGEMICGIVLCAPEGASRDDNIQIICDMYKIVHIDSKCALKNWNDFLSISLIHKKGGTNILDNGSGDQIFPHD